MIDLKNVKHIIKSKLEAERKKIFSKKKIPTEWRSRIQGGLNILICVLIGPVLVGIITSWISRYSGDVELKKIQIIPYEQTNEQSITADMEAEENINSYSELITDDCYNKACAVRALMYCDKPFGTYLNDVTVQVNSIEKGEFAEVSYFAYVEDTVVWVYAINYGNGVFESRNIALYVEEMVGEQKDIIQEYSWENVEISNEKLEVDNDKRAIVHMEDLYGGDGKLIYSFQLNEHFLEELERGNYFGFYADDPYNSYSDRNWIGWITMENGQVRINGGGGAGETNITEPVYIDVSKGADQKILSAASGAITGYSTIELVLIPSESCTIEYSLDYDVEGEIFTTENYKTTFNVPLYEPPLVHEIAEYMNENHIEDFIYQKTNWNLSQKVEYIPKETIDVIQ